MRMRDEPDSDEEEDDDTNSNGDPDDGLDVAEQMSTLSTVNCGLEIKTPSGRQVLQNKILPAKDCHGTFSTCEFGDEAFKMLVYDASYRTQILHHATAANLNYILFVVANETGITYATMVHVPRRKRLVYLEILTGVYERCLKWAYVDAMNSNNPLAHLPEFCEEAILSPKYPIDRDSLSVSYCIWKILLKKVQRAQLPLPLARKIVPLIVSFWNRGKGRIDEMTRLISTMQFDFDQCTPKQMLIMREVMKIAISVYFVKKHCFPLKPVPVGNVYSRIQVHLGHLGKEYTLKEVLLKIATTYTIIHPVLSVVPGSPMPGRLLLCDGNDDDDEIQNRLSRRGLSTWQKEAILYTRKMLDGKRGKFKRFCNDEDLNRIRLDTQLNHAQTTVSTANSYKKKRKAPEDNNDAKESSGNTKKRSQSNNTMSTDETNDAEVEV